MKTYSSTILIILFMSFFASSQNTPNIKWKQRYGGNSEDWVNSMVVTTDGGYAITGLTTSKGKGKMDMSILKTNEEGEVEWKQTCGGYNIDEGTSIINANNGGYAIVGGTTSKGKGVSDMWFVKINNKGTIQWEQTYGGANDDLAKSIVATSDGGYAVLGMTQSKGNGGYDIWLIKTDNKGRIQWEQTYGGVTNEQANSIITSSDGDYVIAGLTTTKGNKNIWLIKTDNRGEIQWEETYGGNENYNTRSLIATSDGGYAVMGEYKNGNRGMRLFKTNKLGEIQWRQTIKLKKSDNVYSMVEAPNGGITLAGNYASYRKGVFDMWIGKISQSGELLWQKTIGDTNDNWATSISATQDGGYAMAGGIGSMRKDAYDMWLVKFDSDYEKPKGPPELTLKENTLKFKDNDGNNRLDANESASISFTLANRGEGIAQGLETEIKEENAIHGLDFELTKSPENIQPGEAKGYRIELKGNQELATGKAKVEINVKEHFGFDAEPITITFHTHEFKPPKPVITDQIFTAPATGQMQKGVTINLKLAIQNKGNNPIQNLKVSFNSPEKVMGMGDSNFNFGKLSPGQNKTITYSFLTKNEYQNQEVPIEVNIREIYGKYNKKRTFTASLQESMRKSGSLTVETQDEKVDEHESTKILSKVDRNIPEINFSRPNDVAVIIGNKNYEKTDPVQFALHDARTLKKYLINMLGFKESNVLYLENADKSEFELLFGTEDNPRGKLYNILQKSKSNLFIYYSGHGAPDPESNKGYFVPVNADPHYIELQGYSLVTFYQNLSKLPSDNKTIVLDACFSGAGLFDNVSTIKVEVKEKYRQQRDMAILTSSKGKQFSSWYNAKEHGLFTWFFLNALHDYKKTDANNDDKVTIQEVYNYLSDNNNGVPQLARRLHGVEQTPTLIGGNSDKVLFAF